MLTKTEHCWQR